MSPFEALYGCKPPTIPSYTCESTFISILDEALTIRDELLLSLKANILQAQNRMSQKANSHRQNFAFAVGDKVIVRLGPYRQLSVFYIINISSISSIMVLIRYLNALVQWHTSYSYLQKVAYIRYSIFQLLKLSMVTRTLRVRIFLHIVLIINQLNNLWKFWPTKLF